MSDINTTGLDLGNDIQIDLYEMISSFSAALDLINPDLDMHHKMVCYIAITLAEDMKLGHDDFNSVFMASILHDIGAIAVKDRAKLASFEVKGPHLHAELGDILLRKFSLFKKIGDLVRYHHVPWDNGQGVMFRGKNVPLYSHLIHLADRIAVLVPSGSGLFDHVADIRERINNGRGTLFHPDYVDVFLEISRREVFWLDLVSPHLDRILKRKSSFPKVQLNLDELTELSRFYALIIDAKSRFTASHSSGVAASAQAIAHLSGMTAVACKKIKVAGYLHDIGKLAIPDSILEKPGDLSIEDWRQMRTHTYYTKTILEQITDLGEIIDWAADHHENLKGEGYPFHRASSELALGSRVVAVADVFTALSEDRPYRAGMSKERIILILTEMMNQEKLDRHVVSCVIDNFDEVAVIRAEAQSRETAELEDFWARAET